MLDDQLLEACESGSAEKVECLLARGANPNASRPSGGRPLHLAACFGEDPERKINALLGAGANPNSQTSVTLLPDDEGTAGRETPLHYAVRREALLNSPKGCAVIQVLLDGGADPTIADSTGRTPTALALALDCNHLVGPHCLPPTP